MSSRRIAVIGAGPSALFLVAALAERSPEPLSIDIVDRLHSPYGLVRYGVAPDHANIKAIIATFQKVFERENVRFLGNVHLGRDLTVAELRAHYDAVCYAVGASTDRQLHVPGEDLPGSISATDLVMWYSGHPDAAFDSAIHEAMADAIPKARTVSVIGAGNVAIDVTRILAKSADELRKTDIPDYVLDVLAESAIRDIHLIARRGPAQAKFTTAELRELGEIPGVEVELDARDLELDEASAAAVAGSAIGKRNMEVFRSFALRSCAGAARCVHFRFFLSPMKIEGEERVEAILLQHNVLDAGQNAVPIDRTERLETQLVLRSVGYRGIALTGLPFDERTGTIPNQAGRVLDGSGSPLRGHYVVGWIKRGPTGVIGTNKADALETAKSILEDLPVLEPRAVAEPGAFDALLRERGITVIDWQAWLEIDRREIAAGIASGRDRVKITDFRLVSRTTGR